MKAFSVKVFINSSPEAVWNVLTDAANWKTWNPTIESIEGEILPDHKLRVFTKLSPGRAFPVRVSEFTPPRRMVWVGGMPFGLFKGVRTYEISPAKGGVEFSMREEFSGPLSGLIGRSIPDLQPSFEEFASALKKRVETAA